MITEEHEREDVVVDVAETKSTQEEAIVTPTPLPVGRLIVIFITFALDHLNFSTLAPYMGFMIADFNIVEDQDERKIGYYAGLLGSSYYCTQLFAAFIWGYMSDRIGRRPVILIGITGSCITSLLFGFSTNIYWAIGTRMLLGALNGNVGVCKTYIGEVTDKTNQAKAFSYVGMSFSTSLIAGPLIGGFLSRPVTQYPNLFKQDSIIKQFLTRFPYVLPNLVVFTLCVIGFVTAFIFIKETNKQVLEKTKDAQDVEADHVELIESTEDHTQDAEVTLDNELAHPPSIHVDQLKEITQEQELTEMEQNTFKIGSRTFTFPKWWPKNEITTTRAPLLTCFIYSLLGLVTISFQEVIPLWSLLPLSQKGLGFDPSKIGILGLVSGFVIGFLQIALMARILKKFGAMWAFRIASLIVVPFFPFYPEISYLGGNSVLLWAVLIVVFFIRFSCTECMYTCMNLMMNNSVTSVSRGKLNGLAMSLISLMRAIGPAGGAALFSLSNFLPFPFDVHLMFILFSVSFTIIFCISLALPKTINEPKISK
ncbi:hypothetical protein AKO1_010370 [Acrasis kona]|uniref:Major facilitator superfamily (MFS) profile domain-containing protein n=1 Tax=Acrasis kona TaxID=1008807 RepID=A0AAW2Z2E0_9EUKA